MPKDIENEIGPFAQSLTIQNAIIKHRYMKEFPIFNIHREKSRNILAQYCRIKLI